MSKNIKSTGGRDRVSNGYTLCALEDLNRWTKDKVRKGITGDSGVP